MTWLRVDPVPTVLARYVLLIFLNLRVRVLVSFSLCLSLPHLPQFRGRPARRWGRLDGGLGALATVEADGPDWVGELHRRSTPQKKEGEGRKAVVVGKLRFRQSATVATMAAELWQNPSTLRWVAVVARTRWRRGVGEGEDDDRVQRRRDGGGA